MMYALDYRLMPDGSLNVQACDDETDCDYLVNVNYRESTASLTSWSHGNGFCLSPASCSERLRVEMWAAHDDGLRDEYRRLAREMSLAETA